jgi:hypothetical protein
MLAAYEKNVGVLLRNVGALLRNVGGKKTELKKK